MKQSIETEVAVIGAGPGGYTAAFRAADLGKNVTIIEMEKALGGVCLNHGCIPSKALLHISKVIHEADSVKYCGVNFQPPQIDLDKLRGYKEKVVSQLNRGIVNMVKARKINVLHGIAKFDSKNRLSIQTKDDEVKLSFQNAIISTGSSPKPIHGFPMDHPNLLTSTEALQLHKIPESLLIVGG
ncbi:MAG: FAD-dependent oxidoreductase, partial [Fidelibacterota bacterium]